MPQHNLFKWFTWFAFVVNLVFVLPIGIRGVVRGTNTHSNIQLIAGCFAAFIGIVGVITQGRIILKGNYQMSQRRV
jgi:hypothetical protein